MVILESDLGHSGAVRWTEIDDPASISIDHLRQTLAQQWGIEIQSAKDYTLQASLSDRPVLIDSDAEWQLVCRQRPRGAQRDILRVRLLSREAALQSASGKETHLPYVSLQSSVKRLEAQLEDLQKQRIGTSAASTERTTQSEQPAQPAQPRYAFHSIEPQPIKARQSRIQAEQGPQSSSSSAENTEKPSLDEIMARSRRQGEALNQLFGAMQARSAGRPVEITAATDADTHEEQPLSTSDAVPPHDPSSVRPLAASEGPADSAHSAPVVSERVQGINSYLDNAWQERLAQMGHSTDASAGSAYARAQRSTQGRHTEGDPSDPEPHHENTATVVGDSDRAYDSHAEDRSDLPGISEESQQHASVPIPLDGPSPSAALAVRDSPSDDRAHVSATDETTLPDTSNAVRLRNRFFRRRNFSRRKRPSTTASGTVSEIQTPDGAQTPHSYASSTRPRRPMSVRSLSDALLRSFHDRSGKAESIRSRTSMTPYNGEGVRPSASSLNGMASSSASQRSRKFSQLSMLAGPQSSTDQRPEQSQDVPLAVNQTAMPPQQAEVGSSSRVSTGTTRPALLRASQSSPLSSTAVNLSAAGGITLHVSSVPSSPFGEANGGVPNAADFPPMLQGEEHRISLFETMLPREIQLCCLKALVQSHIEGDGLASRPNSRRSHRIEGQANAMRELIRLSRVSRSWQRLVFDGQLWTDLDASAIDGISNDSLRRIVRIAGPFVRSLSLRHMQNASSQLLIDLTSTSSRSAGEHDGPATAPATPAGAPRHRTLSLGGCTSMGFGMGIGSSFGLTALTSLDLQGCRAITTEALHHALVRLPQLRKLNLASLTSPTDETCLLLGATLPHLIALDLSRCIKVTGKGILDLIDAAQGNMYDQRLFAPHDRRALVEGAGSDVALPMQDLRLTGLRGIDVDTLTSIAHAMRSLQMLDLSYCPDVDDNAMAAFVQHPGPARAASDPASISTSSPSNFVTGVACEDRQRGVYIVLTPRQAGAPLLGDDYHFRRLHPHLRHLNLSSCRGIGERTCIQLAHAMPQLRSLQLANIGTSLRDAGLAKLLETTPLIERVDVEGATELGSLFLRSLIPPLAYLESVGLGAAGTASSGGLRDGLGRIGRRSWRRSRSQPPMEMDGAQATTTATRTPVAVPTGAHLTHLVASHLHQVEPGTLLTLIRRCPNLIHLQVDDTQANDALLAEFVDLAHRRRAVGAYISLVDCRGVSKNTNAAIFAAGLARPRQGHVGSAYADLHFHQAGAEANEAANHPSSGTSSETTSTTTASSSPLSSPDECDDHLVVVKTFWAWQSVDARVRHHRRLEAKRMAKLAKAQGRSNKSSDGARLSAVRLRDPLAAALSYLANGGGGQEEDDLDEGQGRWQRLATGLLGTGDEEDDARGCSIM